MKILIIANPRTGSTYLGQWLSDRYKLPYLHEPTFVDKLTTLLDTHDSFCMKIVISQLYYHYSHGLKLKIDESIIQFYELISKYKFDYIILLDRRNQTNHIEALINLDRNRHNGYAFKEWVYNDEFKKSITDDEWNRWEHYTLECKRWLNKISDKFNIPIIYYEDVYYDSENVDLQGLEFKPDLSKRQRKNPYNSII